MSKKHPDLKVHELVDWLNAEEVMYTQSPREAKILWANLRGNLRITVNGEPVWSGTSPQEAVDRYNAIHEKFVREPFTL